MIVTAYKTPKITFGGELFRVLDSCLPKLNEKSVVVITSKIISICQGRVIKATTHEDKHSIVKREADYYIENKAMGDIGFYLTIKNDILIANSGVDESNGNGYFILWPEDVHNTSTKIWKHLKEKNNIARLGIVISDSRIVPMRWGTLGLGISWCGFEALNNYIGTSDIFGRKLRVTKSAVLDGLAAAAVTVIGEGNEQTPLAVITDVPFVHFQNHTPTAKELESMRISREKDIYAPLTNSPHWKKGHAK